MGVPGWPEFACCTASIDRVRMVLMQSLSMQCRSDGPFASDGLGSYTSIFARFSTEADAR